MQDYNPRILILSNHPTWTYKLRGEVLQALVTEGYKVIVAVGYGPEVEKMKAIGCEFVDIPYNRRSINPLKEAKLFLSYRNLINKVKPNAVLTYTIKPNLYGAYICRSSNIPCIINITGLGSALETPGLSRFIFLLMYKIAMKRAFRIFFQNEANRELFVKHGIVKDNDVLLPGSGVNLSLYRPIKYPERGALNFAFISRILKAKGIEELLNAAIVIRNKYPYTQFHICGFCDQDYMGLINDLAGKGIVKYHGMVPDIKAIYSMSHCVVLPSWSEGMNNVLLESAASARPVITTNIPGCKEIVDDGITGFLVKPRDSNDLIIKLEHFILLPYHEKVAMGLAGRKKVESQFNRNIVVGEYMKAVKKAIT